MVEWGRTGNLGRVELVDGAGHVPINDGRFVPMHQGGQQTLAAPVPMGALVEREEQMQLRVDVGPEGRQTVERVRRGRGRVEEQGEDDETEETCPDDLQDRPPVRYQIPWPSARCRGGR